MAECPNCHNPVKDDERFCGSCGTRLEPKAQPPAAANSAAPTPPRPSGKETVVLPRITDLGMSPPSPPPATDATIISSPQPASRPPATDATIISGTPASPPPASPPASPYGGYAGAPASPPPASPPASPYGGYAGAPNIPSMPTPAAQSGSNVWRIVAIIAGIGVLACVALSISGYIIYRRASTSTNNALATVNAGLSQDSGVLETAVSTGVETAQPKPSTTPRATQAPRPTAVPASDVLLSDNFDDPSKSNFAADDGEKSSRAFVNGAYAITVKQSKLFSWAPANGDYGDVVVELDATIEGSDQSAAGIMFHFQDDKNFYIFRVTGDKYYTLSVYKDDEAKTLIDWTEEPTINGPGDMNKLRVETKGENIRLFVNDKLLGEVSDGTFTHGEVAMVAATFDTPKTTVNFDNLVIRDNK